MTEEIIIDGVNVAGCEFAKLPIMKRPKNLVEKLFGKNEVIKNVSVSCGIKDLEGDFLNYCGRNKNCYYKQLKQAENTVNECHKYLAELEDKIDRLEQENERLKDKAIHFEMANDIKKQEIDSLREYLERLEQENKTLKELNTKICEDWEKEIKVYWNALEEIREIAEDIIENDVYENSDTKAEKILNKIDEILNKG